MIDKIIEKDDVRRILEVLLSQYNVPFTVRNVSDSQIFEVKMFGTKIIYLDGQHFDRSETDGWNVAWIHPDYTISKAREIIVWALVPGGYFHYLRMNYKRTFQSMIHDGWDRRIVEERLHRFKRKPKYNYFRELNLDAQRVAGSYMLSMDPGFYDFMVNDDR